MADKPHPGQMERNVMAEKLGALPEAPLAMPKQVLEQPHGIWAWFWPFYWGRARGIGH